jgi:hypothetical protein
MVTNSLEEYYDFTPFRSSYNGFRCMTNDLIFDGAGNLYATDFYGYQVLQITPGGNVSVAYSDTDYLCNPSGSTCPPSPDNDYPLNGPNGIEYIDGALLVGISPNRLVKIDLSVSPLDNAYSIVTQTPSDGLQGIDGMCQRIVHNLCRFTDHCPILIMLSLSLSLSLPLLSPSLPPCLPLFLFSLPLSLYPPSPACLPLPALEGMKLSPDGTQLYIAGYGTTGSIILASSDDDWSSIIVHNAYNAMCVNDGTTAIAIAGSDVLAFCSNNFGAAPYNVSVLIGIVETSGSSPSSLSIPII